MRFNFRRVLSLLVVVPSTLAAVNGACSNGVKGICISTSTCNSYGGTISSGNCPDDPSDIKCCSDISCSFIVPEKFKHIRYFGKCMFTNECNYSTVPNLCPGGSNFKCCSQMTPALPAK